ncbi:MAG: helix-turn-helix domain-containing protein [Deltaproteobacteria bacterium]|nr:helix-turn-helix domain-containing protein [Deltaproteobacteria bacterium]
MSLTREDIRKIRGALGLTEKEMGKLIGVTQTSISRYETGTSKPTADAENKILQLQSVIEDQKELLAFREILSSGGGIAAAASILTLGSSAGVGLISLTSPIGLLAGVAGLTLYKALKKIFNDDNKGG